jgi:hypothetical protein
MDLGAGVVVSSTQLAKVIDQGPTGSQMRHLDRVESRLNHRGAEDGKKTDTLAFSAKRLRPGVTLLGSRVAGQKENLDIAMPDAFAEKSFVDPNCLDMQGRTSMKFTDDALKRCNVPLAWHIAVSYSAAHKCAGISWVTISWPRAALTRELLFCDVIAIYSRICTS